MATLRHKKPENWIGAVARNGHGLQGEELLDAADKGREALLMGLRLAEGVDLTRVARVTGLAVETIVDAGAIASLSGLIARDGERLRVTEAGILLLDSILPRVVR